ncbi:Thymidylate kinase, partial [Lamellibrachia satsuma]
DRETAIGNIINQYLKKKYKLEDHAIHLLFTANTWESVPKMKELLQNGTTLVVDRYAYSGVAYSAAKQGIDMSWCRQTEIGLPKPDAVMFLQLSPEAASKRDGFGEERYEQKEFQDKVAQNYNKLKDESWKV